MTPQIFDTDLIYITIFGYDMIHCNDPGQEYNSSVYFHAIDKNQEYIKIA
jgi:hypothetical protein